MDNKEIQLQKALETNESLKNVLSDAKKQTNPTTLKKGMKQKSIIGAILLLILVLTGTFAWQSYQQRAINPFYDPSGNHGVRFHDRLELEDATLLPGQDRFGYANMVDPNLNIFAENFGDMDVFVRIQLREFFAIDNADYGFYDDTATTPVPAVRNNPNTWPVFRTSDTNINQRRYSTPAYRMGHEDIIIQLGQPEGDAGRLAFMPTFNHAVQMANATMIQPDVVTPFVHYNAFRMSEATGAAVDWFTNYNGSDGQNLPDEYVGSGVTNPGLIGDHIRYYILRGIPTGPGVTDPTGANPLTIAERRLLDTGDRTTDWSENDPLTSRRIYTYGIEPNVELRLSTPATPGASADGTFTHTAQYNQAWYIDWSTSTNGSTAADLPTNPLYQNGAPQPFRGVMTIRQWHQLGQPHGNFWIHDSQDEGGWFYWMGYLEQGYNPEAGITNATSLLLEAVDLPNLPGEWEYAIYMNGQAFTRPYINQLSPYISEAALAIFDSLLDTTPRPVGGNISITAEGDISVSDSLLAVGVTPASFIMPFAEVDPVLRGTLPDIVDLDLVNVYAAGDWSFRFDGHILTFIYGTGYQEFRIRFANVSPLTVTRSLDVAHGGVVVESRGYDGFEWSDWQVVADNIVNDGNLSFSVDPSIPTIGSNEIYVTTSENSPVGSRTVRAEWTTPNGNTIEATRPVVITYRPQYRVRWSATTTLTFPRTQATDHGGAIVERRTHNGTTWSGWSAVAEDVLATGNLRYDITGGVGVAAGISADEEQITSATNSPAGARNVRAQWTTPTLTESVDTVSATRPIMVTLRPEYRVRFRYTSQLLITRAENINHGGAIVERRTHNGTTWSGWTEVTGAPLTAGELEYDIHGGTGVPTGIGANSTQVTTAEDATIGTRNVRAQWTTPDLTESVATVSATRPIRIGWRPFYFMWWNWSTQLQVGRNRSSAHEGVSIYREEYNWGNWTWEEVTGTALAAGNLRFEIYPTAAGITVNNTQVSATNAAPLGTRNLRALWNRPEFSEGTPIITSQRGLNVSTLGFPLAAGTCPQTGEPGSREARNVWRDTTGVDWCVIRTSGNYSQLVTRRIHGNQLQNHHTNVFVPWPARTDHAGGPANRDVLNNWWHNNNNNSPALRGAAVHANIGIERTDPLQINPSFSQAWSNSTLSTPRAGSTGGLPFFLSKRERVGGGLTATNGNAGIGSGANAYWLRDPGCQIGHPSCGTSFAGSVNVGTLHTSVLGQGAGHALYAWSATGTWSPSGLNAGIRPTVWVRR